MKKQIHQLFWGTVAWASLFRSVHAIDPDDPRINKETEKVSESENILGLKNQDLRSGNIDMDSIPVVIASLIETLMAVAGTISVFLLIYFAVRMQLSSGITGDTSGVDQAKKGMIAALVGFLISISAWFLMSRYIEILSQST